MSVTQPDATLPVEAVRAVHAKFRMYAEERVNA